MGMRSGCEAKMRWNTLGISSIFNEADRDVRAVLFVMLLLTQETSTEFRGIAIKELVALFRAATAEWEQVFFGVTKYGR